MRNKKRIEMLEFRVEEMRRTIQHLIENEMRTDKTFERIMEEFDVIRDDINHIVENGDNNG